MLLAVDLVVVVLVAEEITGIVKVVTMCATALVVVILAVAGVILMEVDVHDNEAVEKTDLSCEIYSTYVAYGEVQSGMQEEL